MPCKTKQLNPEVMEKVLEFFQTHIDKSYRAWEISQELGLDKDEVSKAIKQLKEEGKISWRCAYKLS